jgi:hypothetical protein
MPRELKRTDRNQLILDDAISGGKIVLFYRFPETSERVAFQAAAYKRDGDTLIDSSDQAIIDSAIVVLTAIRDGDFTYDGKKISSDPQSEDYREDWKECVAETGADLLTVLGRVVFMGVTAKNATLKMVKGEEVPPFRKSSAA